MPSSWQIAISSALTPVESAAVSSVRLPMPISISAPGYRRRASAYRSRDAMKPKPIGSSTGSIRYGMRRRSSSASVGSSVSSGAPRSGIATTRARLPSSWRATSRFDALMLSTSSAPASTAAQISCASNVSTLTRMPADTRSPTTAPRDGNAWRAADVDDVGAGSVKVLGGAEDLLAGELRGVVDLGEDLDVPVAVVAPGRRAAEMPGNLAQVFRSLVHRDADRVGDHGRIALTESGNHHPIGSARRRQMLRDPRRRHERGHRDVERGDVVRERRRHVGEHAPQARLGELSGDEEDAHQLLGSPLLTNFCGVPAPSGLPASGR